MNEEIKQLIKKFEEIKSGEYIKAVNNRYDGIGHTFESLLGKQPDNFSFPDYNMIEIKTVRSYSKSPINLLSLSPEGKDFFEAKRLYDTYGHKGINQGNEKVLNNDAVCGELTKVGLDNYFSLKVDYEEKKLKLLIYNRKKELIDDYSYWTFKNIKQAMDRKLNTLALIEAWDKTINGQKYYKYWKLNIYKLRSFNVIIKNIEKGKIKIIFSYGTFKSGKRKGEMHNHGTKFSVTKEDINYFFKRIY